MEIDFDPLKQAWRNNVRPNFAMLDRVDTRWVA